MPYTDIYSKADTLMNAYLLDFGDDPQNIKSLRLDLGDEDFINVMEARKGRQIIVSWESGVTDDPQIYWRYI